MSELTGDDKVALLLSTLAPEAAEAVLGRLPPAHASKVRSRLQTLTGSSGDLVKQAKQEFLDVLRIADRPAPSPSPEPAPTTVVESPPPTPPPEPEPVEPTADPVEALKQYSAEKIVAALKTERASTVALVLNAIDVNQATAILKLLPVDTRHEAALRVGQPSTLKPAFITRILGAVVARCQAMAEQPAQATPEQLLLRLADLVRNLSAEDRREIISRLEKTDPEGAQKVRRNLYRFTDIARLDDRTLQGVLSEFSTQTLALSIKGASEEISAKILNNVSKRAKETIAEELELLASAKSSQIEEAQGQFVQILQKLDEEGKLAL